MICFKDCRSKIDKLEQDQEDLKDGCANIMRLKNSSDQNFIDATCRWKCEKEELLAKIMALTKEVESLKMCMNKVTEVATGTITNLVDENKELKKRTSKHKKFTNQNSSTTNVA